MRYLHTSVEKSERKYSWQAAHIDEVAKKVNFICHFDFLIYVDFLDGEDSIIVPKSVRPIIDYKETLIGSKKGAKKQFRQGNLHIREFENHYTVHADKANPAKDPLVHLLIDAPEYLAASIVGLKVAQKTACKAYQGKNDSHAIIKGITAGVRAGAAAAVFSYAITSIVKQVNRKR